LMTLWNNTGSWPRVRAFESGKGNVKTLAEIVVEDVWK
jgi:hypothetical protein